jgi:hypothetical protein
MVWKKLMINWNKGEVSTYEKRLHCHCGEHYSFEKLLDKIHNENKALSKEYQTFRRGKKCSHLQNAR